jgi:hypothetical protein
MTTKKQNQQQILRLWRRMPTKKAKATADPPPWRRMTTKKQRQQQILRLGEG